MSSPEHHHRPVVPPLATPATAAPPVKVSRAGRNLPAAIGSGVVLGVAIIGSLVLWKPAFMVIVVAAVIVAVWELGHAFATGNIRITREPVMAGGVVMVLAAFLFGVLKLEPERAASANLAIDTDTSTVCLDESLADIKSQSQPATVATVRLPAAIK